MVRFPATIVVIANNGADEAAYDFAIPGIAKDATGHEKRL